MDQKAIYKQFRGRAVTVREAALELGCKEDTIRKCMDAMAQSEYFDVIKSQTKVGKSYVVQFRFSNRAGVWDYLISCKWA